MKTATAPMPKPRLPETGDRMSLATIRKGRRPAPDRILVVGVEGVGKSTFAADADAPIFIAGEDGVRHLDVASFPEPTTWMEVLQAVKVLQSQEHQYRTVVIDTVDWIEPLIHEHVCRENGWKDIETPGYGKGYVPATNEFRRLLAELDLLRATKGMEIILLAHAAIRAFSNPAGPDYSRYEPKLQRSASALMKEWSDAVLFAVFEEVVKEGKGTERAKGISTGRRVLHTVRTAAWDAKNRHGLPEEIPLDYAEYAAAREAGRPASPEALLEEAKRLLDLWAPDAKARAVVEQKVKAAEGDATALAKAIDWLQSKVAGKGE